MAPYSVTDASSRAACSLTAVRNEPASGPGDGNTAVDVVMLDVHNLQLRAERAGSGAGRTCTATLTCTDPSGTVSTARSER